MSLLRTPVVWVHILIAVTLLSFSLWFVSRYYLSIPIIWPDESLVADVALNLSQGRGWGTDIMHQMIPDSDRYGFGYPPIHTLVLAATYKLFGFSIITTRAVSVAAGFTLILTVLFTFRTWSKASVVRHSACPAPNGGGNEASTSEESFQPKDPSQMLLVDQDDDTRPSLHILLTWLVPILLLTDREFWRVALMGRPEMLLILFGFLGIITYIKSNFGQITSRNQLIYYLLTALFFSLSLLCHYLGVIWIAALAVHQLIITSQSFIARHSDEASTSEESLPSKHFQIMFQSLKHLFTSAPQYLFALVFLTPILIWLLRPGYFSWFLMVMDLRAGLISPVWWWVSVTTGDWGLKIIYLLYPLLILWSGIVLFRGCHPERSPELVERIDSGFTLRKSSEDLYASKYLNQFYLVLLLFSLIISWRWQHEYAMFVAVFILYLTITRALTIISQQQSRVVSNLNALGIALIPALFIFNFGYLLYNAWYYRPPLYSYPQYISEITDIIPLDATIYMSAVPDPYFGLKQYGYTSLYHFPTIQTDPAAIQTVLDQSDYAIFTHSFDWNTTGQETVKQYLLDHNQNIWYIGGPDQHTATVVRLR